MPLTESIGDILGKLGEILGFKTSGEKHLLEQEEKLRTARADNADRTEKLKEQIAGLERTIRKKKLEHDAARGATRRIVTTEIERLFKELDLLRNREIILNKNLEQLALAIAKLQELRDAGARGVAEDTFDDIAVELEDIVGELKATDRAARGLRDVTYEPEHAAAPNVDERLARMEGKAAPASDEELSPDTLARIAEMESGEQPDEAEKTKE